MSGLRPLLFYCRFIAGGFADLAGLAGLADLIAGVMATISSRILLVLWDRGSLSLVAVLGKIIGGIAFSRPVSGQLLNLKEGCAGSTI